MGVFVGMRPFQGAARIVVVTLVGAIVCSAGARSQAPVASAAPALLAAISDTADRICGIVSTGGSAENGAVQGQVQAELKGLARRLATIGGSASVDISGSKYEGLLQSDLPTALTDLRKCKLGVFDRLSAILLPTGTKTPGLGAPSADLLQAPSNAPVIQTLRTENSINELGLYSCSSDDTSIKCYATLTRLAAGPKDLNVETFAKPDTVKLFDNFHIEHRLRKAYFIDGLGGRQQTTNLSKGESIWIAMEFETVRAVSSVRIVFLWYRDPIELSGPVN